MKDKSVFQTVLGDDWNNLGEIIQKHYSLRPKSNDYICVSGEMIEIKHSLVAKLLIPFGMIFGAIVPFQGRNIPIDVHYNSSPNNSNIYWDRDFKFKRGSFHFKSYMEPVKQNEVIEFVRFGMGIRLSVTVEDKALIFRDIDYIWRIFGRDLSIPGKWLMGKVYVEERPIDEHSFSMEMTLTHPVVGTMFKYSGEFEIKQTVNEQT